MRFLDRGGGDGGAGFAGRSVPEIEIAMGTRIPVRTVDRQESSRRLAEADLPVLRDDGFFEGLHIGGDDAPAPVDHLVPGHEPTAREPLLAGDAMRILRDDARGDHCLRSGGAVEHADFTGLSPWIGRGKKEDPLAIRAFGIGRVVAVDRVSSRHFGNRTDRDVLAPGGHRVVVRESQCSGGTPEQQGGGSGGE